MTMFKHDQEQADELHKKITIFDPNDLLARHGLCSIVAMTGSGKTVLIIDWLNTVYKNFETIIMLSRTAKLQECYDFLDRTLIYDTFDIKLLEQIWEERKAKQMLGSTLKPMLIIMDDIVNDKNVRYSTIMKDIATASRHLKITVWILSQNFTSLPPIVRNNICWSAAFDIDSLKELDQWTGQYLAAVNPRTSKFLFKKIVQEQKYQCIIVENHKVGVPLTEKVKKYKASEVKMPMIKDTRKPEVFATRGQQFCKRF